jgi:hypothetical protein
MEGTPTSASEAAAAPSEQIKFTVVFNKKNLDVEIDPNSTLNNLRIKLGDMTGVAAALQKLMFKGGNILLYICIY